MRLFVALEPPEAEIAELEAVVGPLRREWPELRWVGGDRWHVTLAFLGEVAEDRLEDLSVRLERAAARHGAQTLRIGRGGAFPSARKARVLIAHIEPAEIGASVRPTSSPRTEPDSGTEPSLRADGEAPCEVSARKPGQPGLAGLAALAASVSAAARRAGAPPPDEGRRYRPHLTLARSKQPTDLGELVQALSGFAGRPWTATQVHLIRSYPGPQPRYDTLGSWSLKPG